MKKLLLVAFSASTLLLSGCSNHEKPVSTDTIVQQKSSSEYAKVIAIPSIINDLVNDKATPTVGPQDAKQAVVIFFDYGCGKCAEISKEISILIKKNPKVKFIFKAYPSLKRDAKVANYATLVANEAYLQGGSELFLAYNKAVFSQREQAGKLTVDDVNRVADRLGIKINKNNLRHKASEEELETRKLGKLIGFHGPHSFVVLPTNLASMNSDQLEENADKIYVVAGRETNAVTDNHKEAAKWVATKIENQLKK